MVNYSEWLHRAERFVRGISALPGQWYIQVAIEPPLEPAAVEKLAEALPHGLPQPLRDFYQTASRDAVCNYSWQPPAAELARLRKVLREDDGIGGGTMFCPAAKLAEHHEQLMGWAEMFRDAGGHGPAAARKIADCVPMISVGNGDYIALHVKAQKDDAAVVYVSHEALVSEESPIVPLARDIDQFLFNWERIGYLGPEIWLLDSFLENSASGLLDVNSRLAKKWITLMETLGFPTIS
jgi:SMI1 / KNR4 family (SUKH-1)